MISLSTSTFGVARDANSSESTFWRGDSQSKTVDLVTFYTRVSLISHVCLKIHNKGQI